VLRRPKSTPERAARVFTPPADLLLTEEDLREWRAAIAPALEEAGCEIGAEVVREVRPRSQRATRAGPPRSAAGRRAG
jgi:hypothetical protein